MVYGVCRFVRFAFLFAHASTSHFGCLQFGQDAGRPGVRLIHSWPQRRHLTVSIFFIIIIIHHLGRTPHFLLDIVYYYYYDYNRTSTKKT